jgi:hypothetical protein
MTATADCDAARPHRAALVGGLVPRVIAIAVVGALLASVAAQCFVDNQPYDLAYFHAAGRMWRTGLDPYGPLFARFGAGFIAPDVALWAYPPQWWGVSVALAALDQGSAVIAWKIVNLLALLAGGALLYDALQTPRAEPPVVVILLFLFLLATGDATAITLHLGQTSLLMLLGFALLVHGLRFGAPARQTLGLFILLLKPQFGLFFLLLILAVPQGRRPAAWALVLTAAACVPVPLTLGVDATIESAGRFLTNLSAYGALPWNRPGELTGLSFVAAAAGMPAPPPLLCIIAAFGLAIWLGRRDSGPGKSFDAARLCLIGAAALYAIAPLHPYDQVLMPVLLLALPTVRPWAAACLVTAALLSFRASTAAFDWLGLAERAATGALVQAGIATLAGGLALVAFIARSRPHAQAPHPGNSS